MKKVAVTNLKGGTGKTTAAVNLSAALVPTLRAQRKDCRVLLIDLDAQQNAAESLGMESPDEGLFRLFSGEKLALASLVEETGVPGLDIIRGSEALYKVDQVCAGEPGADQLFARAVAQLPERWDYVIVDLPPDRGLLTYSGLSVADTAIVVVSAEYLPLKQTTKVVKMLEKVRENLNPRLREIRYLVNRLDGRTRASQEVAETLRSHLGEAVFDTAIRANSRLSEAPSHGKPVVLFDPRSMGAADFLALAREFVAAPRPARTAEKGGVVHATA